MRFVVDVATTPHYQRGQKRLLDACISQGVGCKMWGQLPPEWPTHADVPYAFKAFALKEVADANPDATLLWCDACILPVKPLGPLWERIERDGYWFSRNGWRNDEWTADSAYSDLFPDLTPRLARDINSQIPHVVATAFGISLKHEIGRRFLDEYFRLANTKAFCGPWKNTAETPCGPPSTLGHRHDQTAASVLAWRLRMDLTSAPDIFAYPPGDERTILLADGAY